MVLVQNYLKFYKKLLLFYKYLSPSSTMIFLPLLTSIKPLFGADLGFLSNETIRFVGVNSFLLYEMCFLAIIEFMVLK